MHQFACSDIFYCFGNEGESAPPGTQPECKPRASTELEECVTVHPETICVQPGAQPVELSIPNMGDTSNNINIDNNELSQSSELVSKSRETEPEQLQPQAARSPQNSQQMEHSHEEELSTLPDMPATVNGPLSESDKPKLEPELPDFKMSAMAEPDYMDDEDSAELIKPRKLVNPVKTSKNHQELHRELIINQKRGIAGQNKPELQRVMEQRKRDQVVKQKKEEEALKKSDLEQELMKRQQRLDQIEQERLNAEEKRENAPEFVKMKDNLRRTKHEGGDVQVS